MSASSPPLIRRYVRAQRIIHWTGVASFALLLVTGITLTVPPLAFLAAGGSFRWIHRIAAFPFVALPIVYAVLLPHEAKELVVESLTFSADDWRWLKRLPRYLLGSTAGLPPQGRLNAGQKLHHASTFGMFVTVSVSGFVLWFGKGSLGPSGLAIAAIVHDLSVLGLSLLALGHVYFTFLYDAFSAMRTGYVTEEYARLEHRKWLERLPDRGPARE
jgi:formate dehydrogenase subunit gamma